MSDQCRPAITDATELRFNDAGLIPTIAQDVRTGTVLMLAWMNREALEATLATGDAHYFSRSRQKLWRKGEQSGQRQRVHSLRFDCDADAILLMVEQTGVACHTGHRSCFFRELRPDGTAAETAPAEIDPATLYAP